MIGSLMYLIASRPNIMFVVCAYARFQVTPKVSHLHVVKRIFRYLKGQPKLWPLDTKYSPFDLKADTDSDYAGASLDRKSTIGATKKVYGTAFTKLIKKVNKLEKTVKTRQARRKARIVVSSDEEDLEDPSKQGRKIAKIDQDLDISLVQHDAEVQGRHEHDMESDFEFIAVKEVYTVEKKLVLLSHFPLLVLIQPKTRIKAKIDEEERQRIVRVQEEASSFNIEEWDDIQARVEADEEFAQRLQSEEREMYYESEKARLLAKLINERKRYFAAQRAEERRNKPLTNY
ncbi:hypothetical protein Tco_0530849 [Tanacetum coccineum]